METIDICMVIIFIIVLAIIFGLSIVALIDNKIGNVSVNIPPIEVPKSTIIVNIQKDGNDQYYVNVDQKSGTQAYQAVPVDSQNKSKIETFVGDTPGYKEKSIPFSPINPYPVDKVVCNNIPLTNNVVANPYPIACSMQKASDIDFTDFYKKNYSNVMSLKDKMYGGYNYSDYFESANPYEVGKRLFTERDKLLNMPLGYSKPYADIYRLNK
ncbi:MAG: hypothetical protein Edafosvirus8_31 [Edafosvirus sp.]|uniref:Uncharacterized protein n=1 Tax=Edafosvirus sp. TaxID=2487765 RepID=A0A3G4ZWB8_9VIRU|nr:MAG: hypothetical protein Edafosvirus8_31 [Edafosvirus sp.]